MKKHIFKIFISIALITLLALSLASCETAGGYKITFMVGGEVYDYINVSDPSKITAPPDPVLDDYYFIGWYLDDGSFTDEFSPSDYSDGLTSDITVYAGLRDKSWKPSYSVKVDYGDKAEGKTFSIKQGEKLPTDIFPEADWYKVVGFYKDKNFKNEWNLEKDTVWGTATLYAKWEELSFEISFKDGNTLIEKQSFTKSSVITPPEAPAHAGYTVSWDSFELAARDMTVNSVRTPKQFNITYTNTKNAENPNPQTYLYSEAAGAALLPIESDEMAFAGWYCNGLRVTKIPAGSLGDIVLTASWEKFPIKVTYFGAAAGEHTNPTDYRQDGSTVPLTPASRDWFRFDGWYTDAQYQNPIISLDPSITEAITVYAKWSIASYTAYYMNGGEIWRSIGFDVNNKTWDTPPVPSRTGYSGKWEDYTVAPETLYINAVYTPITYSITYNGIRDTDTNDNTKSFTVESGELVLKNPVRRGYTFKGWTYNGSPVTSVPQNINADITLTANWEATVYNIVYTDTQGVNISAFPATYTVESGELLLPQGLTSVGRSFEGWRLNGSPISSIETGSIGDITLTAVWSYITYSITYSGLEYGDTNGNPHTFTVADAGNALNAPYRRGYTFKGWTYNGAPVTAISENTAENITLTAEFEIIEYNITYLNTYGADISSLPVTYNVKSSATVLPQNLSMTGCTFLGWTVNGTYASNIPTGSVGDMTVEAKWEYVSYNITYSGLLPTDENNNPATFTVADGGKALNAPTRIGYTFIGWELDGVRVSALPENTAESIVLTATWKLTEYKISYENTKNADISKLPQTYNMKDGIPALPELTPAGGYKFDGWLNEEGILVTSIPAGSYGDVTLKASFTATPYLITLHPMGGGLGNKSYTVNFDRDYKLPVPEKVGHIFIGWYSNTGSTAVQLTAEDGSSIAPYSFGSDRVFYAHYVPVQCTVTFIANGGTAVKNATYEYGTYFNPKNHISQNGEGMYFAGWQVDGGTAYYTDSTKITSDVTLKAIWLDSIPISTPEQFLAIANNPSGTYHLTNDISFSGETLPPLGDFSGVLDGNGFAIKNFTMSNTSKPSYALFITNNGTIKNIKFESFTYTVSLDLGVVDIICIGVLTAVNNGILENCTFTDGTAKVSISYRYFESGTYEISRTFHTYCGVFAGVNNGTLKNCLNELRVEFGLYLVVSARSNKSAPLHWDTACLGGLVGLNSGYILSCANSNTMSVNSYTACELAGAWDESTTLIDLLYGGITGVNYKSCKNSYSNMNVTLNNTHGRNGSNNLYFGGAVGINYSTIESCFAVGSFSGGATAYNVVGGFVGRNASTDSSSLTIRACHSGMNVSLTQSASRDVGGFVGSNYGKVMNSYSTGTVYCHAASNAVGGFVGTNANGATVTQCFSSSNVTKYSGSTGFFIGDNSSTGIIFKCYYLSAATLNISGNYLHHTTELGNIYAKSYLELWSEELLVDTLEWNEDDWVIIFDETPELDWEINLGHTYKTLVVEPTCTDMGFTVYECTHCARIFLRDFVAPWGHNYPDNPAVVAPDCTTQGYTSHICSVCSHEERTDITEATGHTKGAQVAYTAPTCTVDGAELCACSVCGEEFTTVIPALGHKEYTSKYLIRPACGRDEETGEFYERDGMSKEVRCEVCEEILVESEVIKAHQYILTSTETAATCTEDGLGTYQCEHENCGKIKTDIIEKLGHIDANHDGCCDTCRIFLGRPDADFIEIYTVEDFFAIMENPTVEYILMNDLDFSNVEFIPIGTQRNPFTGYFDGNGYTFRNISFKNAEIAGVFGYNKKGVIRNLTVENIKLDLSNTACTFGGIVAVNDGNISNCKVTGTVTLNLTAGLTATQHIDLDKKMDVIIGGIAGTNSVTSMIYGCVNEAYVLLTVKNNITVNVPFTAGSFLGVLYRPYNNIYRSTLSITFGLIAGTSSGMIESCRVSVTHFNYGWNVETTDNAWKLGIADSILNMTFGGITGANYGSITESSSSVSVTSTGCKSSETLIFKLKKQLYTVNFTFDGRVIAENQSFNSSAS